jgi:hypothetical protein
MRIAAVLTVAAMTFFAPAAQAGAIDVGHGYELGAQFDPSQAITAQKSTLTNQMLHKVQGDAESEELGDIFLALTPETNKIYEIWAVRHFDNSRPCKDLRNDLFDRLQERHPEAQARRAQMSFDGRRTLSEGDTEISIACRTGVDKATFYMRHRHTALHQQVARQ